jgi:hypothetical protein
VPAGFGGRLRGKGPHQRDLAAQPILFQERDSRLLVGTVPDQGQGQGPGTGPDGAARAAAKDPGPGLAALVNITVPLATALGLSGTPGEAGSAGARRPAVENPARTHLHHHPHRIPAVGDRTARGMSAAASSSQVRVGVEHCGRGAAAGLCPP